MRFIKQWLPVILWAGLILSSANDNFSADQSGSWLTRLFGEVPYVLHVAARKLTHVVVYAILAALTWRADRRWWVVMGIALAVASTDEWMQSRAINRTGTVWDVVLDVAGAGSGFFLQRVGQLRHDRPRRR